MLLELRRRSATEKHCSEVASEVRKAGKSVRRTQADFRQEQAGIFKA